MKNSIKTKQDSKHYSIGKLPSASASFPHCHGHPAISLRALGWVLGGFTPKLGLVREKNTLIFPPLFKEVETIILW